MTENVGTMDRVIRILIAVALVATPFAATVTTADNTWAVWAGAVVLLALVATAIAKFCPIYKVFGIRSCSN